MKTKTILHLVLSIALIQSVRAADHVILAEDDASDGAYGSGWKSEGGGSGFGDWAIQTHAGSGGQSFAGSFIVNKQQNPELKGAGLKDKAFGMYANGVSFEASAAFRSLKKPLAVGQTFSFLMQTGDFTKKFDQDDSTPGEIGVVLIRHGIRKCG